MRTYDHELDFRNIKTFKKPIGFSPAIEIQSLWFKISESTARNANIGVICEHFCAGCSEAVWQVFDTY